MQKMLFFRVLVGSVETRWCVTIILTVPGEGGLLPHTSHLQKYPKKRPGKKASR